ncbi:hypothetical protein Tco_0764662 [Tanacetum coccineum]
MFLLNLNLIHNDSHLLQQPSEDGIQDQEGQADPTLMIEIEDDNMQPVVAIQDPSKTKEPQPLPITSTPIPSPDYTPATPYSDEESEDSETSETRITSPHSTTPPSEFTSPLSPINPLSTQTITPPYTF